MMEILNNLGLSFDELKARIPEALSNKKPLKMDVYLIHSETKDIMNVMCINVTQVRIEGSIFRYHAWGQLQDGILKGFNGLGYAHEELDPGFTTRIANMTVKWDTCSHWNLQMNGDEDNDGYYHICGLHSYLDITRALLFPIKFGYEFGIIHEPEEWESFDKSILCGFEYAIYIREE